MEPESAEPHTYVHKYGAALQHKKALGKTAKQSIYSLKITHAQTHMLILNQNKGPEKSVT
jgi:hypothetical protein